MRSLVALLVVALAVPALADEGDKTKLLVLDFKSEDDRIRASALSTMSGLTAAHVSGIAEFDVISSADVKSIMELEGEKASLGCEVDSSCLAEVANAMGARLVIMGQMARLGSFFVLNLSLFDSDEAKTVSRRSLKANNLDQLAVALEPALDEMASEFLGKKVTAANTTTTTTGKSGGGGGGENNIISQIGNKIGKQPGSAKVADVDPVRMGLASAAGGIGGGLGFAVGLFIGLGTTSQLAAGGDLQWPGATLGGSLQNNFYAAMFTYFGTVIGAAYFNDVIGANITALATGIATFITVFGVWSVGAIAGIADTGGLAFTAMGAGAVVSIGTGAVLTPMFIVAPDEAVGNFLFK